MKSGVTWKNIMVLQGIVVLYTFSQILQKYAALQELFSIQFFVFYGLEFMVLGTYAICWQQLIKRFELSVAYANRAVALLWSLLWSVLIFQEEITVGKVVGVSLVGVGVMIINGGKEETSHEVESI
ncbi:MAG: transporter [Eubacteriales bacterium]